MIRTDVASIVIGDFSQSDGADPRLRQLPALQIDDRRQDGSNHDRMDPVHVEDRHVRDERADIHGQQKSSRRTPRFRRRRRVQAGRSDNETTGQAAVSNLATMSGLPVSFMKFANRKSRVMLPSSANSSTFQS